MTDTRNIKSRHKVQPDKNIDIFSNNAWQGCWFGNQTLEEWTKKSDAELREIKDEIRTMHNILKDVD
jgi:hypothetical protein